MRSTRARQTLAAIEAGEAGQPLPEPELPPPSTQDEEPAKLGDESGEAMFREVRRLLASREYDQVIDRLDIHRPAEWAVVDLLGARTLRALGQA